MDTMNEFNEKLYNYYSGLTEADRIAEVSDISYRIRFMSAPSEKVQLAAIQSSTYAITYIDRPTLKAIELHEVLWIL